MTIVFNRLQKFLIQVYTKLWCNAFQVKNGKLYVAGALKILVELDGLALIAFMNILHNLGGFAVATATAFKNVMNTMFSNLLRVTSAEDKVTSSKRGKTESEEVTTDEWQLLIDGDNALASLQNWATHSWPTSPDAFTEEDVQTFLPAARVASLASKLSYSDADDAQRLLGLDFWKAVVIDNDDAQAMLFMAKNNEKNLPPVMIVAFRGTEGPQLDPFKYHKFLPDLLRDCQFLPDWLRNVNMTTKEYFDDDQDEHRVHSGFLSGWRALKGQLMEQIAKFHEERGDVIQLYVTGHSQGAALAGMSLLDLLVEQEQQQLPMYKVQGCLALAAPKHGGRAFASAVAAAVARHHIPFDLLANQSATAGCDPVVCVPPLIGTHSPFYVAPAGRLWVVEAGTKTTGPATDQERDRVVNASLFEAARRTVKATALHSIGTDVGYLRALNE